MISTDFGNYREKEYVAAVTPTVEVQEGDYYWLDKLYDDTYYFNYLAGNHPKVTMQDFKNQADLITEEANELQEAIASNNTVEILDAAVDIAVVLSGLISKLYSLGIDVSSAMEATALNNLSKFPSTKFDFGNVVSKTLEMYKQRGIDVEVSVKNDRYCFTNKETGKVLKPFFYQSNDLTQFCNGITI